MTKFLPANFLEVTAAAVATWAIVNVMWIATLAPAVA